jgi:TolB-like protein/DNA-binding winged helix-turn-helix (wHTH) protein/Tfp pilus assembly protein PilF
MPLSSAPVHVVRFGIFEADFRAGELRKAGLRVRLQDQPFQVLRMLLERPGEPISREDIHKRLWPQDTFVDFDHGLNNAVNRLREALGDSADVPRFIETLPRRGYRFIGTVNGSSSKEEVSAREPQSGVTQKSGRPSAEVNHSTRYGWIALAAAAALLAAFVGLNFRTLQRRWFGQTLSAMHIRSLAVLPLQNLSGDASQEYLADGMTEALITDLATISSLRVISRTSAMHYKGSHQVLPEIARELNVDAVVEGSVARSGNRVRVTAQLVQASSDRHLWAESYERDVSDVLQLQNELARAVAQEVEGKLTPQEQTRLSQVRPVNFEAYEAYLAGLYFMDKWSDEGFEKAAEYFQHAIELDPRNAAAYAELANTYGTMVLRLNMAPAVGWHKAEAAANKAVELDDSSADAHTALGNIREYFHCDQAGAEEEYQRSFALNPTSSEALGYHAWFLANQGRFQEAIAEKKQSLMLDPISPLGTSELGLILGLADQLDEAILQQQKALEMDSNFATAHARLGVHYAQKRQYEKAVSELRKAISLEPAPGRLDVLADTYQKWGKASEARQVATDLVQMSKHRYLPPDFIAAVYARLGEQEEAMKWLEKASADDMPDLSRSEFNSLRSDPRFRNLEERFKAVRPCS